MTTPEKGEAGSTWPPSTICTSGRRTRTGSSIWWPSRCSSGWRPGSGHLQREQTLRRGGRQGHRARVRSSRRRAWAPSTSRRPRGCSDRTALLVCTDPGNALKTGVLNQQLVSGAAGPGQPPHSRDPRRGGGGAVGDRGLLPGSVGRVRGNPERSGTCRRQLAAAVGDSPGGGNAGRDSLQGKGLDAQARTELTELVAFTSVADFDSSRAGEQRAANWVRDALRGRSGQDVACSTPRTARSPCRATCPGPRALRPFSSTRTTTFSRRWTRPLDHPAVRADRARRPLVRTRRGRLQGWLRDAPARVARAQANAVPVGVKVIAEGSEEKGTGGLEELVKQRPELLEADMILSATPATPRSVCRRSTSPCAGWRTSSCTSRRWRGKCTPGMFGGPAPDALAALVRAGHASRRGRQHRSRADPGSAGTVPNTTRSSSATTPRCSTGSGLLGSGSVADRCGRARADVLGIDCPPVVGRRRVQPSARRG